MCNARMLTKAVRFAGIACLAACAAFVGAVNPVHGDIIAYDGFPVGSGGYAAAKTALKDQAITTNAVFGFEWQSWNNGGGSGVVYSFGSDSGLSLPESFAGFTATGASAGFVGTGTPVEARVGEKKLTGLPNEGSVYFRVLLNIDSTCVGAIATPADESARFTATTCYAAGLCGGWDSTAGNYNYFFSNGRSLLFGIAKNLSGDAELDFCVIDSSASKSVYTLVDASSFEPGKTYLCVLKIGIGEGPDGKDAISASAFPVDSYSAFQWTSLGESDAVEAEVWSADGKPGYIGLCGRYLTNNGYFKVDEFALATRLSDVIHYTTEQPVIGECSVSSDGAAFSVSVAMERNTATVKALAYGDGASAPIESAASSPVSPGNSAAIVLSGLEQNKTYELYVAAENEHGAATNSVGVLYNGVPQIAKSVDADESGRVPGAFTVTRADSSYGLVVNIAAAGTAVGGVNYLELPSSVVIPSGETSAAVTVTPLIASPHDSATSLTVSLAEGLYHGSDPAPSATVEIANLAPPAGKNTWVAAADGNASVASNWSLGRVPLETDEIFVDGTYSNAKLTWDCPANGVPSAVASWTQLASYTGTVEIPTRRSGYGDFNCFTVTGDAILNGGRWWRPGNVKNDGSTAKVWLNVKIEGDLAVGEGFTFNGAACGFPKQKGPSTGGEKGGTGGAHGGLGGGGTYGHGSVYGDYRNPITLGSGQYGSDNGGGGSVVIDVAKDFTLNGTVTADAGNGGTGSGQSGGSVWIRAKTMHGTTGIVTANGGSPSNKRAGGGAGRISIQLSDQAWTQATFRENFAGTLRAIGGLDTKDSDTRVPGASGTIYVETAGDNGKGVMRLTNRQRGSSLPAHNAVTLVADGVTWDISRLDMTVNGRVGVAAGGTLAVPSFDAISGDGSSECLLAFIGGTVSSAIKHDRLVANGFKVRTFGEYNSFADHTLVIPDSSALAVSGDFTVGALQLGEVRLAPGDYSAADMATTYTNVSGDGTIHVLGVPNGLIVVIR